MAVNQEVSGKDISLMVAITEGTVPKPPLCDWNGWQKWRRELGKRPVTSTDGGTTTARSESRLHTAIMAQIYGEDWQADLAERGEKSRAGIQVQVHGPVGAVAEGPQACETALVSVPVAAAATPMSSSPGSGHPDSWRNSEPGTPGSLQKRVTKAYDPYQETYDQYAARFRRQIEILDTMGLGLPLEDQEVRLLKARIHAEAVETHRGHEQVVKALKREFAIHLIDQDGVRRRPHQA